MANELREIEKERNRVREREREIQFLTYTPHIYERLDIFLLSKEAIYHSNL